MHKYLFILSSVFSGILLAEDINHNITIKTNPKDSKSMHIERRTFCATLSGNEAYRACQDWLKQQQKTLGSRVLTTFCSSAKNLHTLQEIDGCSNFVSQGEIKFLLND